MASSIERIPPSTAAGVDHVRLAYDYIEKGDADGYASLLAAHAQVRGVRTGCAPSHHELYKIIATGDSVVVTGRYSAPSAEFDFADVFTLSDVGLLLSHRRFRELDEN